MRGTGTKASPPLPSNVPAPLTCAKRTGEPYTRRTRVEVEIAEVLADAPASWSRLIDRHGRTQLQPETLVHLARHALLRGNEAAYGLAAFAVLKKSEPIMAQWARGFDPATFEEIVTEVTAGKGVSLVGLLATAEPTRTSEYLEIDFTVVVKQLTLKAVARRNEMPRARHFVESTDAHGSELPDEGSPDPFVRLIANEEPASRRQLLAAVTDRRHRYAFILRELRGWPYADSDPNVPTLCRKFHPTSKRQIHNWIKHAKEQMRTAYGELR